MHRCIAFFLTILILFNIGGFYALFCGLEYKVSQGSLKKIDSGFLNNDQTLLLKIPLKLPYASNLENYKRVDGVIEHQGTVYRLVKQKFHNDTLQVVVFNDKVSTHINQIKLDFAKTISDKPIQNKGGAGDEIFKNLIKDYINHPFYLNIFNESSSLKACSSSFNNFYSSRCFKLPHIPPELA